MSDKTKSSFFFIHFLAELELLFDPLGLIDSDICHIDSSQTKSLNSLKKATMRSLRLN